VGQLPEAARGPFLSGFDRAAEQGLQLGAGQGGGIAAPGGVAPDLAQRFNQVVHETFGEAFISASRPTLAVAGIVVLAGCLLAIFMKRHKHEGAKPAGSDRRVDAQIHV
jgi:hypothetical protein